MRNLAAEVLCEFGEAGAPHRQKRFEREAQWQAEKLDKERQRDRERKADARDRAAILAEIRRIEGIEEKFCECGCGRMFPVTESGRPRRFATVACRMRNYRKRILEKVVDEAALRKPVPPSL